MRKILIVSSAIAIFGICLLFYLARTSKPRFVPLNEIDSTYIGKTISTSGRIAFCKLQQRKHFSNNL
jgi:hypothetical protein